MIGVASSAEKRELVERLGADATVDSRAEDMREAILEANDGDQVDAVLPDVRRRGVRGAAAHPRPVRPHGHLRDRLARAERGLDGTPDAQLPRRDRLLAHAPDPAPRRGRGDDRRLLRGRRRRRARGRGRRRLSALGGAPGARGHRRAPDDRQAAARPERSSSKGVRHSEFASASLRPATLNPRYACIQRPRPEAGDTRRSSTSSATSSRRRSRSRRSRSCSPATT